MKQFTFKEANKRYLKLYFPAIALYVLFIIGGPFAVHAWPDLVTVKLIAALGASLPLVLAIWALLRFLRETDDFTRAANQQALSLAGAGVAVLAIMAGFFQMYGFLPLIESWWFGVAFFCGFGLAHGLIARKTGTGTCPPEGE